MAYIFKSIAATQFLSNMLFIYVLPDSPWCPDGQAGGGKSLSRLYLTNRKDVRMCRCATSWSDPDLTFDLAAVTLSLKILSKLYLGNCKV